MKQFFALYVKELKANKVLFLFLLLLIVGINVYGFMDNDLDFPLSILAAFILVLSLPFLLAHAFNIEWKSETHY